MGVLSLWQQWMLGDYTQNIPPLKMLDTKDVSHLDGMPESQHPAQKILSDMKYLMNFIENKIREEGKWTDVHDTSTVAEMFHEVEHHIIVRGTNNANHECRDSQIKWQTIVSDLRNKARQENRPPSATSNVE